MPRFSPTSAFHGIGMVNFFPLIDKKVKKSWKCFSHFQLTSTLNRGYEKKNTRRKKDYCFRNLDYKGLVELTTLDRRPCEVFYSSQIFHRSQSSGTD